MEDYKVKLLQELEKLPDYFEYIPVGNNKNAYIPKWQEKPMNKAEMIEHLKNDNRMKAIGVVTDAKRNGLIAIDHDGSSCDPLIESLSGLSLEEALPTTVKFTSGKEGRYQLFYRVPDNYADVNQLLDKNKKPILTGVIDKDRKNEQLDFRHHAKYLTGGQAS